MCYLTKYSRFKSNSLGVGRVPKIFVTQLNAPWNRARGWPLETRFSITCVIYYAKIGHSGSNHTSVDIGDSPEMLDPRVPPFKVTQGHWNRTDRSAIYDFLFAIHSSHGPFIVSEINGDFGQMVERVWRYVHSFRYNTRVWRTDGRTDLP